MLRLATIGLATGCFLSLSTPLMAAPEGNVSYTMVRGDTLNALADDYFSSRSAVRTVLRINNISDARRIPAGRKIQIPRRFLRFEPVNLRVRSFSGPVALTSKGKPAELKKNRQIVEGDEIRTGRNGFISIAGSGASRLSLPSNSRARIIDARKYLINDLVDIQVKVLEGRGNVVAPKLKKQERYRVGTPVAVTAVRGTQFRVGYEPGEDIGLTEVVEGGVSVGNGARSVPAPAGFGIAATPDGVRDAEKLLPAPKMIAPGKTQTGTELSFSIEPFEGASGYRTQISKDAGFLEVVGEVASEETDVVFGSIEDGRYFIRSRAIAQSGLEGLSKTNSFRRKRLGVSAEAARSEFADAFKFAWQTEGSGQSFVDFQLWEAGNRDNLIVDEIGLIEDNMFVSNLPAGNYKWRVAVFQIVEGEAIKVWGPVQELIVTE